MKIVTLLFEIIYKFFLSYCKMEFMYLPGTSTCKLFLRKKNLA